MRKWSVLSRKILKRLLFKIYVLEWLNIACVRIHIKYEVWLCTDAANADADARNRQIMIGYTRMVLYQMREKTTKV